MLEVKAELEAEQWRRAGKEYELYPDSHRLLWHDVNRDEVLDRITRRVLGGAI